MNQDGNTAMPQNPSFSSPNPDTPPTTPAGQPAQPIMSTPDDAPVAQPIMSAPDDEPAPEAPAPSVATTAAAMPDNGATGAITSAPEGNSSRGLFTNRRFSKKQQPAAPTTFAGAPDFFNQAAAQSNDYITIGEEPKATDPGTKKRLIILGAIVGVAAIIAIVGAVIMPVISQTTAKNEAVKAWNKIGNLIIYGEEKEDDLPEEQPRGADLYIADYTKQKSDDYYDNLLKEAKSFKDLIKNTKNNDSYFEKIKNMVSLINEMVVSHKALNVSNYEMSLMLKQYSEEDCINDVKEKIGLGNISEGLVQQQTSEYIVAAVAKSALYNNYNCFDENGVIKVGCNSEIASVDNTYEQVDMKEKNAKFSLIAIQNGIHNNVATRIYEIKELINDI